MFTNSKIKITVDKSHLFTLGEKMYRESIEFVRELVNNGYDADATQVNVSISDDKIVVEDDGSGMSEKGLEQFFTIGSEEKKTKSVSPRFGRKRIGQFGIGKFSALSLADQFIVESVKGNYKYSVIFDKANWQANSSWDLPITKEKITPFDKDGTRVILNKLKKKISLAETEKYLKQSVPLKAKKFSIYLNNKKITATIIAGKIIPVKINTIYGLIEGEIIIALNASDVDEPGIECRIKQVLIKRELFDLEKKYHQGISRVTGSINADFLPLISSRSDFVIDSPQYKLFAQLIKTQLSRVLEEFKKQSDTKNIKKITQELRDVMSQIREALMLNPDFVPQGKAITRLKNDGKKEIAIASANIKEKNDEMPDPENNETRKQKNEKTEEENKKEDIPKIEAKPLIVKSIKLQKLGISCGIISLGENGPEVTSRGNMVYVNQDHPLYKTLYKKSDLLSLHLFRLITQEIVLMKKIKITAREAFEWQSKLLKDGWLAK